MKLIESLKQIKDLQRKADDLRVKVSKHSAYLSNETPVYPNQQNIVEGWIQAHSDILKEILRLRIAIQRTNLSTMVTVKLDDKDVTKSIAEWVHRRRDLAKGEEAMWRMLTDRNLKEGHLPQSTGQPIEVKIVRCYNPLTRDKMLSLYQSEPSTIDAKLEIANALTSLLEE